MAMVRQFDEESVLDKALEVFWQKGWQATSMSDLAEATQVQRGSLYHAYGGKEQIFLLAYERYTKCFLSEAQAALDAPSASLALRRFFDFAIGNMSIGSPPRGCLTTKMAGESDEVSPVVQECLRTLLDRLETRIAESLSREPLRSSLSIPPAQAARMIVVFSRGLTVIERVYHDPDRLHATARSFTKLLLGTST
ncbi:bacterial regulatory s, tetR family protein [Burkholderia thailandensis MSMB121]|uniref:TetR/AcrR family transcriptional regulator n=1 Tax=Burkholderia TaxID=32008 RepID=UPI000328103F|nr:MULTISPECIES: helix-turn-helix domain-containing protein [Burkholderia]AGK47336.1 bacterial regulatory s, tetR family protein [Burkholderia thailandensis MSMB121]ATF37621.1 TetR/AcrR family transcriptional regulator [Burkholderia thailandensis]KST75930.1 TetR family transcriptional regulator [Burkholderia humptydooensis]